MSPSPLEIVREWIGRINRRDLPALVELMTDNHTFYVEGERPTSGRAAMEKAWRGYFNAFPNYRIFEDEHQERGNIVFIVGHTTGSHMPAHLEAQPSCVIWQAAIEDGRIAEWVIYPATEAHRRRFGLRVESQNGDGA